MKIDLRDYQELAFQKARQAVANGKKRILIVAPTAAGKTVLGSAFMEMTAAKLNRATFVIDRLSLLDQTSETFDRYGLDHGVMQGQHPRWRPYERLQLCSIQTLARRQWPDSNVDLFDEAHVLHAAHKKRIEHGDSIVIGLTATPFTKGLGKYFDEVINVTTTRKLINDGWLSPYRIFSCSQPDMDGVRVVRGEWDEKESSKRALEIVGDVVDEYIKHGEGRKFICSAVDTAHVESLAEQFTAAGIEVATYTYKDRVEDRADTTKEFRKKDSRIRGLITVTAASRGFDIPDVSCVIMARPLRKSLAEHIQLFGRGLRIADGKKDCIVLCHSGNAARFYAATEEFFDVGCLELDDGTKKEKKKAEKKDVEPVKCPSCRSLHNPSPVCPYCGHEYPKRQAVAHVAGTLKELIAGGHREELTKRLWPQIVSYALERRKGEAAKKQALGIYKGMTGQWPTVPFEDVKAYGVSPEVRNRIKASQIAYAKATQKAARKSA